MLGGYVPAGDVDNQSVNEYVPVLRSNGVGLDCARSVVAVTKTKSARTTLTGVIFFICVAIKILEQIIVFYTRNYGTFALR